MDVRWYGVHCVAMMNQMVGPTKLAKAAYQFAIPILT